MRGQRKKFKSCSALTAIILVVFVPANALSQSTHPKTTTQPTLTGLWHGAIALPTGPLKIGIAFSEQPDRSFTGTVDIPAQIFKDGHLIEIQFDDQSAVAFSIDKIPGHPTFHGQLKDEQIAGAFTQGSATFPFVLTRGPLKPIVRPQEPVGLRPYREVDVTYPQGDITLAGTLVIPPGEGPFPAALLITGSGPQDRDEMLLDHKPFLIIADRLARAGIATLRVDDRGVGRSGGVFNKTTIDDQLNDIRAGISFLKSRKEIAGNHVGLIGHSEGGIFAPIVASAADERKDEEHHVAFVVLLAGTGLSGREVLIKQNIDILKVNGASDAVIQFQIGTLNSLIDRVEAGDDSEQLLSAGDAIADRHASLLGIKSPTTTSTNPSDVTKPTAARRQVRAMAEAIDSLPMRNFLALDPRPALAHLQVPLLALGGERDLQVNADQNLPEIARLAKSGGDLDVTTRKLPELNHLFQHSKTGAISEYSQIEETFSDDALKIITDWINERSSAKPQ